MCESSSTSSIGQAKQIKEKGKKETRADCCSRSVDVTRIATRTLVLLAHSGWWKSFIWLVTIICVLGHVSMMQQSGNADFDGLATPSAPPPKKLFVYGPTQRPKAMKFSSKCQRHWPLSIGRDRVALFVSTTLADLDKVGS